MTEPPSKVAHNLPKFNPRLFNHELCNPLVETFMVENFMAENLMVENFMVENFMVETSWLKSPATLYKAGFHNVDGVDYSEQALALAHKLAKDSDIPDLNFFVSIFLDLFFIKFLMGGDSKVWIHAFCSYKKRSYKKH